MKRKDLQAKILAGMMTVSMVGSLLPGATALAAETSYKDGEYSGTATVEPTGRKPDFSAYDITVNVKISEGKITNVSFADSNTYGGDDENKSYSKDAMDGYTYGGTTYVGVGAQIIAKNGTEGIDAVSEATCTSNAIVTAVKGVLENAAVPDTPELDLSALEKAISNAAELNQDDYTQESWAALQKELKAAEEAKTATSQEDVTKAANALEAAIAALRRTEEEVTYVLMNIPYDKFYAAELNNNEPVDVFTSATKSKTRASLAAGSYHQNEVGDEIAGITYPVKVKQSDLSALAGYTVITDDSVVTIKVTNRGETKETDYEGKDALFESPSYSYYVLGEAPSYYKELTVNADGSMSFGKVQGEVTAVGTDELQVKFETESPYGDYRLALEGIEKLISGDVSAVVISTEKHDYGLRHIENIWRTYDLAWCTGFTKEVHGCPTSSAHYASMMGETIDKVTYYTTDGIYEIDLDDTYVPIKFEGSVQVEDALVSSGRTVVTMTGLPEAFDAKYSVEGLDNVTIKDGILTFDADKTAPGSYTLKVSDESGKYASLTADFEIYTNDVPAVYDAEKKALVKTTDASDDEFTDYIASITAVAVDGTSYAASGKRATTIINKDGTIAADAKPISDGENHILKVSAVGYQDLVIVYSAEDIYVMMNIPYDKFYAADLNNDEPVDVFTSATKSKTRASLAAGSYHQDAVGDEITGITYPVKVSAGTSFIAGTEVTDESVVSITVTNRGKTTTTKYEGIKALFESPSYSYYVLGEAPSYYKELTVNADGSMSFGKVQGEVTAVDADKLQVEFKTESPYGDYGLALEGIEELISGDVSAVVISTEEGHDYGLRHIENIWRTYDLAWCTGFTDAVHSCPTSSAHYESMMGETINKVTYYTTEGIYVVDLSGDDSKYVPYKFDYELSVDDAMVSAGETTIHITGLPKDFKAGYSVEYVEGEETKVLEGTAADGSKLTFDPASTEKGSYTLRITDKAGKYADITADFMLNTDKMPAAFNGNMEAPALVAADGATEEEFKDYLSSITSVSVNGTEYAASGRNAKKIVKEDGSIDTSVVALADGDKIIVNSTGYLPLEFTYTAASDGKDDGTGGNTGDKNDGTGGSTGDNSGSNSTNNSTNSSSTDKTSTDSSKNSSSSGSKAAKTGDVSGILNLFCIAAASAGAGGYAWKRKREKR